MSFARLLSQLGKPLLSRIASSRVRNISFTKWPGGLEVLCDRSIQRLAVRVYRRPSLAKSACLVSDYVSVDKISYINFEYIL